MYELVNSWEDIQQRYREIKSIWDAYWETLGGKDNIASYEGGKLFIFVASSLVPGLGQLSKVKRVKAVLEELKGFSKTGGTNWLPAWVMGQTGAWELEVL